MKNVDTVECGSIIDPIEKALFDFGGTIRECVVYHDRKYIKYALSAAFRYCLFNPPIRVYRHADANIFCSKVLPKVRRGFHNTGCFASRYFGEQIWLDHLEKSCKEGATHHFFFGPAICIDSPKLFKLFKTYEKKPGQGKGGVVLHYRDKLDKDGWDRKHFSLYYLHDYSEEKDDVLKIESSHDEKSPDSDKTFWVFKREEENYWKESLNGLGFEYFTALTKKFDEEIPVKTIDNIFDSLQTEFSGEEVGGFIEDGTNYKRYKGFIKRKGNTIEIAKKGDVEKSLVK